MLEEDAFGAVHPRDAMLPEAVLLFLRLYTGTSGGGKRLERQENETVILERDTFEAFWIELRDGWKTAWSKEYREMDDGRLLENVRRYMKDWMLLREEGDFASFFRQSES